MKPIRQLPAILPANFVFVLLILVLISACKKEKGPGTVEISESKTNAVRTVKMDFIAGSETTNFLTLKNGGSVSVHVKLKTDVDAVHAAKAMVLSTSLYSLPLEYDVPANGSISVPITITNKLNVPMDTVYGVGLKIDTATNAVFNKAAPSVVLKFDLRNKWDGRYRVTGSMTDIAAPTITGYFPQDVALITSGPNQLTTVPRDLGIPGFLILSGTSLSYYGSFGPVFKFNETNDKIYEVLNSYGQPASNTRSAEIDPSGTNQYNATTKNFTVKFYMKQPNTVTTSPYIRVYFNNTFTYLGPRYEP